MNTISHLRKRLRRLENVWAHHDTYYLTVCTYSRACVLAEEVIFQRMNEFCRESLQRYGVWFDCFVLMPDHLHYLITFSPDSVTLGEWVKAMKYVLSKREFRWQVGCFDHILRSTESRSEKWEYIRMNPVRAGLVDVPEKWMFAVRFHPKDGSLLM